MKYYSVDNAVMIRNQKRYQKVDVDGDAETNVCTQQMIEEMVQLLKSKCFGKSKERMVLKVLNMYTEN